MFSKTIATVLALFLLISTTTEAMSLARTATELRCQCTVLETKQISTKLLQSMDLIPSGPHCKNDEVIFTLKTGLVTCVDPSTPWVQKIVKAFLERQKKEEEDV